MWRPNGGAKSWWEVRPARISIVLAPKILESWTFRSIFYLKEKGSHLCNLTRGNCSITHYKPKISDQNCTKTESAVWWIGSIISLLWSSSIPTTSLQYQLGVWVLSFTTLMAFFSLHKTYFVNCFALFHTRITKILYDSKSKSMFNQLFTVLTTLTASKATT